MTAQARAAVWIDHHTARVFHVYLESFDETTLKAPIHHVHRHPEDEQHFFADVAKALEPSEEILLLGPSTAKNQFVKYLNEHAPALAGRVAAVETSDHPSDAEIVAHVKSHFRIPPPRLR